MADSDVAALLEEREFYVLRGLSDRVAQVDAALAGYGVAVAPETAVAEHEAETATPAKPAKRTAKKRA